ncbi:MAG: uroporphyrinogen-III synthase [Colwellia sp.]|nr:uroporphyrinogen-III synthase [Colwellia sp.]
MITTDSNSKLNALITRPEHKAQQLSVALKQQGIFCVNQPLFDYQALANVNTCKTLLTKVDIIIFVSVAAVEFATKSYPVNNWQYGQILAVGKATQKALQSLGINSVITPSQENSEGLLTLPLLANCTKGKIITIVRGNGGRELLASTLMAKGAKVTYLESYQRVWRTLAKDVSKQWYQQKINCIVVTSNALLEELYQLTISYSASIQSQPLINYWQKQCVWLVVSKRIEQHAQQLALTNVIVSEGASEESICRALNMLNVNEN